MEATNGLAAGFIGRLGGGASSVILSSFVQVGNVTGNPATASIQLAGAKLPTGENFYVNGIEVNGDPPSFSIPGTSLTIAGLFNLNAATLEIQNPDSDNDNRSVWCDSDGTGEIEVAERTNDNRVWDFSGGSDSLPAITCTPRGVARQPGLV